jgi:hypothetical protein
MRLRKFLKDEAKLNSSLTIKAKRELSSMLATVRTQFNDCQDYRQGVPDHETECHLGKLPAC